MSSGDDLWQKSLSHVMEITGLFAVDCDVGHGGPCDSSLRHLASRPYDRGMPPCQLRQVSPSIATPSGRDSSQTSSRSIQLVNASKFRPRPLQVTWEMTQSCGWRTSSTRAAVRSPRDKNEFSTAEAFHLVEEVAAMHIPLLALTGGDPLLRPDLLPVIELASRHSVRTSLTVLPTSLLDSQVISEVTECGLVRVAFWLHGSTESLRRCPLGRWISSAYPRSDRNVPRGPTPGPDQYHHRAPELS